MSRGVPGPFVRVLSELRPLIGPLGRGVGSPRVGLAATAAVVALLLGALALGGNRAVGNGESTLERYEFSHASMGTEFRIVLYAPAAPAARRAAEAAFARVDELDRRLSDYRPESELSRLSAAAGSGGAVPLSQDLWSVLEAAQSIATLTDGAFDVTVGPFTRLWRWASRRGRLVPPDRLAEARSAVGHRLLRLDADRRTATLERPGMRLDLGGIGKGYAADAALATLRTRGIDRALVDAGGDVVAGAPPPGKAGWPIEVPTAMTTDESIARSGPESSPQSSAAPTSESSTEWIALARGAIATSGDVSRFVVVDGVRYSHILDPRTGIPLRDRRVVAVLAPTATRADALASALSVLGPGSGVTLADGLAGVHARIIELNGTGRRPVESRGWPREQGETWTADDS